MKERITARVVLINSENKILLLKISSKNDGISWIIPGGGVEESETLLESAQRELFEETGIKNVQFVTPHAWYSEDILEIHGEQTFFKEFIFLAYTNKTAVTFLNLSESECNEFVDFAWWDIVEFKKKGDALFPRGLLDYLNVPLLHNNKQN